MIHRFEQHGPAPHGRLSLVDQVAETDRLHSVAEHGLNLLLLVHFGAGADRAEHSRNARAVDVGVEQADLQSAFLQGQGQVDGHCTFADSAFA